MNKPDGKDRIIHKLGVIIANLTIEKEVAIAQRDELAEYIANLKKREDDTDGTSEKHDGINQTQGANGRENDVANAGEAGDLRQLRRTK